LKSIEVTYDPVYTHKIQCGIINTIKLFKGCEKKKMNKNKNLYIVNFLTFSFTSSTLF
jgi:hypothetical protein